MPNNDVVMLDGGPIVDSDRLEAELGWTVKPEGLCRDDVCVPVPDRATVQTDDGFDVLAIARLLDRPAVHDVDSDVVAIGVPRDRRRSALGLTAPDVRLFDLDGTPHALSDHRSKKRLLVAFASW